MDHSSSIITQVSRDEEENAPLGEEGEFRQRKQSYGEVFLLRRYRTLVVRSGHTVSLTHTLIHTQVEFRAAFLAF